jgi:hypothetical protein
VIAVEAMSSVTARPRTLTVFRRRLENPFVAKVIARDNGIRLHAAHSDRVFDVFRSESPGIEFGLSVCRLHRGAWWKRTLPGNPDSSVALQFPLHAGAETFREGLRRIIRLPTRHRTGRKAGGHIRHR